MKTAMGARIWLLLTAMFAFAVAAPLETLATNHNLGTFGGTKSISGKITSSDKISTAGIYLGGTGTYIHPTWLDLSSTTYAHIYSFTAAASGTMRISSFSTSHSSGYGSVSIYAYATRTTEFYNLGSGTMPVTKGAEYYVRVYSTSALNQSFSFTLYVPGNSGGGGGGGGGSGGGGTSTRPDLSPYTPSGWASSMVLSTYSSSRGNTYTTFKDTDNIYLSWAFHCSGASISSTFYTYLYVDGVKKYSWKSEGLSSGYYSSDTGHSLGKLSAGSHTIKLVTDATGVVSESNESNNTITRTITVTQDTHLMTMYRNNSSGDGAGARRKVPNGGYYTLPTISSLGWTRSGYTFKGWATYRGATTATYRDGERIYVSSSLTSLYAVWGSHAMTLYRNNSSGDGAGARRTVPDGWYYTLPTISSLGWSRSGYTFKGWATYRGATTATYRDGERIYVGSSLYSLYAVWEYTAVTYTVRLHRNNSAGDGATAGRTMVVDSWRNLPTIDSLGWSRPGYYFVGWAYYPSASYYDVYYVDGESVRNLSYYSGDEVHLYAVWW